MHPAQKAAMEWQSKAVERCRNDPTVAAAELCHVCMSARPCLCENKQTVREMRIYYEANRRTLLRDEPKLIGSWGIDMDGLMTGLFKIATEKHREYLAKAKASNPEPR